MQANQGQGQPVWATQAPPNYPAYQHNSRPVVCADDSENRSLCGMHVRVSFFTRLEYINGINTHGHKLFF
jgi:hypothetical protein